MVSGLQARLTQTRLLSADDTAKSMTRLVSLYSKDLGNKINWPLSKFYNYVKNLPFKSDPPGHESIARPKYTLQDSWPWRDCDDKAILIGSWLYANRIPFRFQASSKAPSGHLHHVYVVATIDGKPFPIDATYPRNKLGELDHGITKTQNLTGEIMYPTLNVFEGDPQELLGFSFRKLGRGIKRNKWGIASAVALGPAGVVGYQAWKQRKKLKKTLSGEMYAINPELMGASFMKRMARKAKKATVKIAKVPGLKEAIASTIPGGSLLLSQARSINKIYQANKGSAPADISAVPAIPEAPAVQQEGLSTNKKLLIGAGVVGLVGLVLIAKKR